MALENDTTEPTYQQDGSRLAPNGLSRRRVLVSAAGIGAIGLSGSMLVACGGKNDDTTTPRDTDTGDPGSGASDEIATTDQVPEGGGLILADSKVVITQPTSGDFKCFTAVCTHQGCIVSSVADNKILCACHGSQYDAATGEVTQGPATKALAPEGITITGSSISLA